MDEELNKLIKVWTVATTALLYCYHIASRLPKGILRLISISPVIYLFIILPLYLTSIQLSGFTCTFLSILGNMKLLLFSFDEGPLSQAPPNVLHFIVIASIPIKLKQDQKNTKSRTTTNPKNRSMPTVFLFGVKLLVLFVLLFSFVNYRSHMHQLIVTFLCGGVLYFELEIISTSLPTILGHEIIPFSNHPYLSTSLQSFWGRRWNPNINDILRNVFFNPVRGIFSPAAGSKWASLIAILVTFLVSGLVHEALYFYVTRASPTWEVTWFFILQGFCVSIEVAVKSVVRDRWRLHPVISGALTLVFIIVTGYCLFFPQLKRHRAHEKWVEECLIVATFFIDKIKNLVSRS